MSFLSYNQRRQSTRDWSTLKLNYKSQLEEFCMSINSRLYRFKHSYFKCLTRRYDSSAYNKLWSTQWQWSPQDHSATKACMDTSTRTLNTVITQLSRKCNLIIVQFQLTGTALKVLHNIMFAFEIFTTQTTAKLFVVRVNQLMTFQFRECTETLWTLTTYIRLHTFMSK